MCCVITTKIMESVFFPSLFHCSETTLTTCAFRFLPLPVPILHNTTVCNELTLFYFCMAFCVLWRKVSCDRVNVQVCIMYFVQDEKGSFSIFDMSPHYLYILTN